MSDLTAFEHEILSAVRAERPAKDLAAERNVTPSAVAHAKRAAIRKARTCARNMTDEPLRSAIELPLAEDRVNGRKKR